MPINFVEQILRQRANEKLAKQQRKDEKVQDKINKINRRKIRNEVLNGVQHPKAMIKEIKSHITQGLLFNMKPSKAVMKGKPVLLVNVWGNKYNKRDFGRKTIKEIGNNISNTLHDAGVRGSITTNLHFKDFSRSGRQTSIGNQIQIYDAGEYEEDVRDNLKDQKHFNSLTFYIMVDGANQRGGADDYNNDCLYKCIIEVMSKKSPFKSGTHLKNFLKLDRKEPVDIKYMSDIENEIKKVGINVTGDYIYTSKLNLNRNINIKLLNGHYSLNTAVTRKPHFISFKEKTIIIQDKNTFEGFDGNVKFKITKEILDEIYKFKTEYILIPKSNPKLSLEEEYKEFIIMANELRLKSNDKINLYKTGSMKNTALYLFDSTTKDIQSETIEQDEALWISDSTCGAITFYEKYEGPAYKYDEKSEYPSILQNNYFMIPIKRGIFKQMTTEEFEALKYYPTGIYKCKIEKSNNPKIDRLFRFNINNKYTNISLNDAKLLNLKITLIEDNQVNVLFYPRSHCLTGSQVFKKYVDILFPLKEQKINGAKMLLNIISGAIGEINEKLTMVDEESDEQYNIPSDFSVVNIKSVRGQPNKTLVYTVNNNKYFKSNFARLKPFMLAKGRSNIITYILPHNDKVVKCNTDSIVSTEELNIKTGSKIGNLVFEGFCKHIKIKNNGKEKVIS